MISHVAPGLSGLAPSMIANELDDAGIIRIADAVSASWLADMRAMVSDAVTASDTTTDLYFDRADQHPGTPPHQLTSDTGLRQLLHDTTRLRCPLPPAIDGANEPLRCSMLVQCGTVNTSPSHRFHYDLCPLTMIVPIFIPDTRFGTGAELVAAPNQRTFRRSQIANIIDKTITQNPIYRHHFTRKVHHNPERYHVPLRPGDAILFWGYRTYHGNLAITPGLLRSTLVLKYGQVHHTDDRIAHMSWKIRQSTRATRQLHTPGPDDTPPENVPHQASTSTSADSHQL